MELFKTIFNSWEFNIVAAVITSVIYVQYYKLAVKETKHEGMATVILEFWGGVGAMLLIPFFAFKFSLDWWIVILFVLANIFYTLNDRLKTIVRKNLEVAIFSVIDQLSKVFLIVYGLILFRDPIVVTKLIGGALIILGGMSLFYHQKKFSFNKYIILAILAALIKATALVIDVDISRQFNLPFYIMLTLLIPAFFNYLSGLYPLKSLVQEFNSKRRKYYLISGLVSGPMMFFTIRALQLGRVAFIAPLLATTVLLNVLVASIIHQEKNNLVRKIIVALIIIIGIYLTVI